VNEKKTEEKNFYLKAENNQTNKHWCSLGNSKKRQEKRTENRDKLFIVSYMLVYQLYISKAKIKLFPFVCLVVC
jgi:hypothetical protein